jgi:hypothetical protein
MLSAISRPAAASARHQIRSSDKSNLLMTVSYRPGRIDDLSAVFGVVQRTNADFGERLGIMRFSRLRHAADIAERWRRNRPLYEHVARTAEHFWIAARWAIGSSTRTNTSTSRSHRRPWLVCRRSASVGQPFTFQVTGDLTIKDKRSRRPSRWPFRRQSTERPRGPPRRRSTTPTGTSAFRPYPSSPAWTTTWCCNSASAQRPLLEPIAHTSMKAPLLW